MQLVGPLRAQGSNIPAVIFCRSSCYCILIINKSDNRSSVWWVCRPSLEVSGPCLLEMSVSKMGWVTMSERDLQRIEVLTDVLAGKRTVAAAATVLAISERQMYRLLAKYEDGGGSALIHKARGRQSNRSLNAGIRRYAVVLVRTRDADIGPTLATEVLLEKPASLRC
jgi:hypothetical protein